MSGAINSDLFSADTLMTVIVTNVKNYEKKSVVCVLEISHYA